MQIFKEKQHSKIQTCLVLVGCLILLCSCGQEEKIDIQPGSDREAKQHTLKYSAGDGGFIDGETVQAVERGADGSEVTAVADTGYHLTSWSDGVTAASRIDRGISEDLEVTANFSLNQYTLTYTAGDNGSIEGPTSQVVDHGADGESVTAVPLEHHYFSTWSDGVRTPSRTDRAVMTDIDLTADFEINRYTLSYAAGKNGRIDGVEHQTVNHGQDGSKVTAVAREGYHFTAWNDGLNTPDRTARAVTADRNVTAQFEVNQYTLTYEPGEHGTIEGELQQAVKHGEEGGQVVAVAEQGYHFVRWSDGLETPQRIDSQPAGDLVARAIFAVNTYTAGGTVSGLVDGTQLVLHNQAGDELDIITNGDFRFTTELRDAAAYEISIKSQPVSPNQTCTIEAGLGEISSADVDNVIVSCTINTYTIGGMVTGLADKDRFVLQNNAGDDLTINANGAFAFAVPLEDGSPYEITIARPPGKPNWTCDLSNSAGTLSGSDVNDITVSCYVKAVLQATPGIRKVKLDWNDYDFTDVTFQLCSSQGGLPETEIGECQEVEGGTLVQNVVSPHTVDDLINDIPYWFRLEVLQAEGLKTYSEVIESMAFGGLNDTGVDWCADNIANRQFDGTREEMTESCQALSGPLPGQDAHFGRDALARERKLPKTGHGNAGFDFTKLCRNGKVAGDRGCSPNPSPGKGSRNWGCTRDNVTGLVWEVKASSGLQSSANTYSWYSPDKSLNGGDPGSKNGGQCEGSDCDTHTFMQKINEQELCGLSDWRLPTKRELLSIVDNSSLKPAVDTRFFPNTVPAYYWSSSPYADQSALAWQVYFLYGEASPDEKSQARHLRLVSGRTMTFGLDNPR